MLPVLPVLGPEVVGVETAADQAGDNGAVLCIVSEALGSLGGGTMGPCCVGKNIQDRKLAPEVCRAIGSVHGIQEAAAGQ